MEFNKMSIANLICDKMKFEKMCKGDLEFAFEVFVKNQEYEKCSIIKDLLEIEYYDNRKKNNNEIFLNAEENINSISSGKISLNDIDINKEREKIKKIKKEIEKFYDMVFEDGDDKIIIPPFKNKKNIEYFLNI